MLRFVPGSVSEQVKRLVGDGLVDHERYKSIFLTPAGHLETMRAVRVNRMLRCFLHDVLSLPWSELATNADALEASSSPRFLQRIEAALDQPTHDPYGHPIPTADGRIEAHQDTPLWELARRRWVPVRITRVADAPVETLAFLDERRLSPGTRLHIRASTAEVDIIEARTAPWPSTLLPAGAAVLHA
ncbi:metal-dependent transcriptional regulator, partial [Streptomyces sp. NPDC059618]|uniref:metal-dependent transcriptional regulator n=1 Tax=Streptomyces sp. NPDC059618 TaxID=3346887 RepID=UPI00369224A2